MKKKILIVSQHFWPEDFRINDIAEGFISEGVEVDVLCGIPNYPKGFFFEGYSMFKNRKQIHNGAKIYRAYEIPRGKRSVGIFLNYVSFPFFASFTMLRLLRNHYDAVFCYETSPVLMIFPAILFSKIRKLPLTTYVLDLWPENLYSVLPIQNQFLKKVAAGVSAWHYRKGGRLMAMSVPQRQRLLEVTGKEASDIAIFPQYCEDFYAENSFPKETVGKVFNVMFAGNFSPAQGLDTLIDAAIILKNENVTGVCFSMYGEGMSHKEFCDRIKACGVERFFLMYGRVFPEEVVEASKDADALFISLCGSEMLDMTIPAKISSCMAMCRPLLCCLSGAGAKAVSDAQCALVSKPEDAKALAENIKKMHTFTQNERIEMSQNAKNYYNVHFSKKVLLPQMIRYILGV